ncbi:carbohydrate-binding module family 18 protein [Hyaloscypha hepaticicola]|uniref:Carbohydrate-binding module family 18 protein n=1 Tax=Hyaloscypha hepaticicola TaxID=2082293 RepID=A0A2J6PXS8_9HELO|nr:carbohydrate-binding module family 18 protein [Hyaloscypha hepaticicola]
MGYFKLFSILAFVAFAHAHMEMSFPPPFRSKYNPNVNSGSVDYSMTSPLSASGSNFPCKLYQSDLGTPAGASVVTWTQGSSVNFTIVGGATHGGGSCQAALSYDSAKSWTVIHSFIGSCPLSSGQNFDLTIPSDAPTGKAVFAWTWYNEVGNREIYQNCASITIAAGSGTKRASTVAFSSRPDMFVANMGNGCTTVESEDVVYPNPGPDVTGSSTKGGTGFTGTCAAVNGIGGGSSSSSSGGSAGSSPAASSPAPPASSPAANSPAPVATQASSVSSASVPSLTIIPVTSSASATPSSFITSTTSSVPSASAPAAPPSPIASPAASSSTGTGSAPASSGSSTSGITPTTDGQCSGTQTCAGSTYGQCCSQWGWCGVTSMHCGTGCMEAFSGAGACGTFSNATTTAAARVRAVKARGLLLA